MKHNCANATMFYQDKKSNEGELHCQLAAEINLAKRVTLLQSMNYSRLVQPTFKQLFSYGCW
jgi:hypothetical protein